MIGPSLLIRWGALGTLVLLVRAIVREAQEERQTVALLPASSSPPRPRVRAAGRKEMVDPPAEWDEVAEALDESFPASDPPAR